MDMHAPRKRIKELEVMVAEAIQETHDTTTLLLFTGNDRLDYQAGHFLTIDPHQFEALERFISYFEDVKGKKEPPRAYSLSSAPHEKFLAITIKEERYTTGITKYPPLLSPLLVKRTTRGMRLTITGFTGPYVLPPDLDKKYEHLLHVCAGSGIVPNYSILKQSLQEHPKVKHTLLYSNKTWADAIFARDLHELQKQHPDRLKVVHTLTREPAQTLAGPYGVARPGRIGPALLKELVDDPKATVAFACGPGITPHDRAEARKNGTQPMPRFLETVLSGPREIGFTDENLEYESYG